MNSPLHFTKMSSFCSLSTQRFGGWGLGDGQEPIPRSRPFQILSLKDSISSIAACWGSFHRSQGRSCGEHLMYSRQEELREAPLALLHIAAAAFAEWTIGAIQVE